MRDIPVEKNKTYIIDITSSGNDGEGVGKIDNFTIFVHGAIINEKVEILIIKVNKNYALGKILKILTPSPQRVNPNCSVYTKCGGCQLQHISYEGQLEFKRRKVEDALKRIGKFENILVNKVIGMDEPYRYRNKVQLPVGGVSDDIRVGFYSPRSHNIVDIDECIIQTKEADLAIKILKEWMKEFNISPYIEETHSGDIRHIMVRKGFKTGELMVVLVTKDEKISHLDVLVDKMLKNIQGVKSIVQNINKGRTNIILGNKCKTIWGNDYIEDDIGKFKYRIYPLSFFQVNPVQTEKLYNKALEFAQLSGNEIVFDAYCGAGTISLFLSQKSKKVYGVEIVPEAVKAGVENAKLNGVENVEFIEGQSEDVIPKLIKQGVKPDVVVVDPPRKGCEKSLLDAIGQSCPSKIIYVSCDPATLARDLAILKEYGYYIEEVQPVDMFPGTGHVECVVLMQRCGSESKN